MVAPCFEESIEQFAKTIREHPRIVRVNLWALWDIRDDLKAQGAAILSRILESNTSIIEFKLEGIPLKHLNPLLVRNLRMHLEQKGSSSTLPCRLRAFSKSAIFGFLRRNAQVFANVWKAPINETIIVL